MSEMQYEGVPEQLGTPSPLEESIVMGDPSQNNMARYAIHVPLKDSDRNDIPHVLAQLRQSLTNAGFPGRTVIPLTQGDWEGDKTSYSTDEMAIVMVDTPDTPENLEAIKAACQGVKDLARLDTVYMTVQPLRTYLI